MNTLTIMFQAIQLLIQALLPAVKTIENLTTSAELYSEQVLDQAKVAKAISTDEYLTKLNELNLDSDLKRTKRVKGKKPKA